MKNIFITLLAFAAMTFSLTSCSHYKSIENAERMVDLARNTFMKRLSKSIMGDIRQIAQQEKTNLTSSIKLTSVLSSVVPSTSMGIFINTLSTKYNIPLSKIEEGKNQWRAIRDVIGFVAKNGKGFEFYKW